jgi:SAM-dependent methyltransferase
MPPAPSSDPRQRFTDRVEHYERYRPGYPRRLVEDVWKVTGMRPDWVVADVGCGTGLSSLPFLNLGVRVLGVEPNAAMGAAARRLLADRPEFDLVTGSAEATGLGSGTVDLVTAGQAFHWFDRERAREEFLRILVPPRWVALFWNTRRTAGTSFAERYEELLLRFGTDYAEVRHDRDELEPVASFFHGTPTHFSIEHGQSLDLEGLRGRLLSSSFTPAPDDPARESMLQAMEAVFAATHEGGYVRMVYDAELWVGTLDPQD